MKPIIKHLLSGVLSVAMAFSAIPIVPAHADESTKSYPYMMFAASDAEGSITVNCGNFCANGNIATNGTIVSSGNLNINGTITENAGKDMIYALKKLDYAYFSSDNVETHIDDYSYSETNININVPLEVGGTLELTGNINLNSGIKAVEDVNINGEVKNSNNAVICSETGDINIYTTNVNFNGLIYAPFGDIVIDSDNLNLNNAILIAQTITLDCPNVNANYNSTMAEIVGTESDTDIELFALGSYDEDANVIDIEWQSNYGNSTYGIFCSDDNINYNHIATVTDSTEYQYFITDDFETRYFKVVLTTNYGEKIETVPFVVTKDEYDYYDVEFLDSDNDGLPDVLEIAIGTRPDLADTDGDTLTDYQEVYITGTDPTVYDSVIEGVSDADADCDSDGLSNSYEIELGSDPCSEFSDEDEFNDYDEVYIYGTDPTKTDTDDDGISDSSEIKLGLDLNDPQTFGIPDSEYSFYQVISADSKVLSEINTEGSPYTLSVELDTNMYAEDEITAEISGYSKAIENEAMLGNGVDIAISDVCNPENIVIKYTVKDTYLENTDGTFSSLPEFQGIRRLNVFKLDTETNMLLPIETKFDDNNVLYAEVDEFGTYCIMDMEIWLNAIGVEMPEEASISSVKYAPGKPSNDYIADITTEPINLYFILQADGTSESCFNEEKDLITYFFSYVIEKYADVSVNATVICFRKTNANLMTNSFGGYRFATVSDLEATLNNITYTYENDYCDRGQAFKILLNTHLLNYENNSFVYIFQNGATNCHTLYDNEDVISMVKDRAVKAYCEIVPVGWHYEDPSFGEKIFNGITNNGDLFAVLGNDTLRLMEEHFASKPLNTNATYSIIVPNSWKAIHLNDPITQDGTTDTDADGLTDWEEVNTDLLLWHDDGSFELPTFTVSAYMVNCSRYNTPIYDFLKYDTPPIKYLPILSDPTEEDSDGDDLYDGQAHYLSAQDFTMPKDPMPLLKTYFPKFGTEEYKQYTEQNYDGVDYQIKHMMSTVNRCEYTDLVSDEDWLRFCEYFNERVLEYGKITQDIHYFRLKLNRTPDSFEELVAHKDDWYIYTKDNTRYHMNNCLYTESYFNNSNIASIISYNKYKGYFNKTEFTSENSAYPSYSTYGNEYNMKFVDKYGMNEVVVTPNKDLSGMTHEEIYTYLLKASNWQILTADYNKSQNDSNYKYDPVNVGTYNYCGYEKGIEFVYSYDETEKKTSTSDDHQKYDVKPYLGGKKSCSNWGNAPGMIYGNTKKQRNNNGDYYTDTADQDVYEMWWERKFSKNE